MDKLMRFKIADYLNVSEVTGTEEYALMGIGFNTLDENPNAQTDQKTYINQKSSSTSIKGYQPQFPYDADVCLDEKAIMSLYKVGRNHLTGADAEKDYIKVDLYDPVDTNVFKARKFRVCVEVSGAAGAGGEPIVSSGNLNSVGDLIQGTFNTTTKKFTEGDYVAVLGALNVSSVAGTNVGDTLISVTPTLTSGNSYVYKTSASEALPVVNAVCSTGYTIWDGISDIAATTGDKILIVEIDGTGKAKKAGIASVLARAETLGTLTVTSEAGTASGDTKITVSPLLTSGNSYVYKTSAITTFPTINEVLTTGYTVWDGLADITATTGNEIMIVEVDSSNKAKKAGKITVSAKA